jgi:hypothetical protein
LGKYLRNQCIDKSRCVDTNLVGLFVPYNEDNGVTFYPSIEYLEAGKYKLPKSILRQKGESKDYATFYSGVVQQNSDNTVKLNFGSIGIVCGVKAEQAKKILTDIFAGLIELCRKLTREVKLSFIRFGSLMLYKNGELSFDV